MALSVLVVGGSGFIGSYLVRRCLGAGYSVRIIDKKMRPEFANITTEVDITAPDFLDLKCDADILINLAASHADNNTNEEYELNNVFGATCVVEFCLRNSIRKLVFTSSVAVYGKDRDSNHWLVRPENPYGESKLRAEVIYSEWASLGDGNSLSIIRPAAVFGLGNRGNIFNLMKLAQWQVDICIGQQKQKKSLAYVENVVACLEVLMMTREPGVAFVDYIDEPNLSVSEIKKIVRHDKEKIRLKIPVVVALKLAALFDFVYGLVGKSNPFSRVRVLKLTTETVFKKHYPPNFCPVFDIRQALFDTSAKEFCKKDVWLGTSKAEQQR